MFGGWVRVSHAGRCGDTWRTGAGTLGGLLRKLSADRCGDIQRAGEWDICCIGISLCGGHMHAFVVDESGVA